MSRPGIHCFKRQCLVNTVNRRNSQQKRCFLQISSERTGLSLPASSSIGCFQQEARDAFFRAHWYRLLCCIASVSPASSSPADLTIRTCTSKKNINIGKSELDTKQVFEFIGFQFDLKECKVRPTVDRWVDTDCKNQRVINWTLLSGPSTDVPHGAVDSHRRASPPKATSHDAHTVLPQKQLEGQRRTEVVIPVPRSLHPHLHGGWRTQCAPRPTSTPTTTCSATVYKCITRGLGHSLKRSHCKGNSVPSRKQTKHILSRTKRSLVGPKRGPNPL